jgi:hypothetical protein
MCGATRDDDCVSRDPKKTAFAELIEYCLFVAHRRSPPLHRGLHQTAGAGCGLLSLVRYTCTIEYADAGSGHALDLSDCFGVRAWLRREWGKMNR